MARPVTLTGKDPPALEMVQKIQALQKRLIARKEDIVDRELNIQEKERVIDELKGKARCHCFVSPHSLIYLFSVKLTPEFILSCLFLVDSSGPPSLK